MGLPAEKLAEIDEELASFGKSDEELAAVVERAVTLTSALAGEDGLGELLEGREEALAAARDAAQASLPERPAPLPDRPPVPVVESEPPPPAEEPVEEAPAKAAEGADSVADAVAGLAEEGDEEPTGDFGSDLLELSEEEPSEGSLPPLELDESEPPPAELTADLGESAEASEQIEAAFGEEASSDIAGLSVDELFADAEPEPASTASSGDISGLFSEKAIESALQQTEEAEEAEEPQRVSSVDISDLFDDEEEGDDEEIALRLSDPELDIEQVSAAALQEAPAEAPPEVPAAEAAAAEAPPAEAPPAEAEFPAFDDENSDESTMNIHLDDIEMVSGDDFELLVDEEVLELDMDEGAAPAAAEAAAEGEGDEEEDEDGEKKGLISRILGRK